MNRAVLENDWAGRVVDGKFPLLEWLGSTEQGAVFRTQLQGSRKGAIRLIRADSEDAQAEIDGWAAAANLSHPHLMRLFSTGRCYIDHDELLYVVTEYAEEALSQVLRERPLTPAEAREMLNPVLDALSYVHGEGLVYGQLKPSNIMVVESQLKLPVDSHRRPGSVTQAHGTPQIYDAPETVAGAILQAADTWSLGMTLVEAFTQHPPTWDRSKNADPLVPDSIPQPFADIARKCLRHDPSRRCTLREIQTLLNPVRSLPVTAGKIDQAAPSRSPKPATESRPAGPSTRRVELLIAAVLVLVGIVAAALLMRSPKSPPGPPAEKQSSVPAIGVPPQQSPVAQSPVAQAPVVQTPTSRGSLIKGEVADRVLPEVSTQANRTIRGRIKLRVRVTVDPGGKVSNAAFDSPGPSRYFANQALQAARKWKFKPPQVDNQPVSSVWILRFEFRRSRIDITPLEMSP